MNSTNDLRSLLIKIIDAPEPMKSFLIKEFQDSIWGDQVIYNDFLNTFLLNLADDIDFYEPNECWRKEDVSYYGEEK